MVPELITVKNNSNITNWSLKDGYEKLVQKKDYPYRIFNAKQFAGFYVILQMSSEDIDYICAGLLEGFKGTHGETNWF